jgi:hypothetical protein
MHVSFMVLVVFVYYSTMVQTYSFWTCQESLRVLHKVTTVNFVYMLYYLRQKLSLPMYTVIQLSQ